MALRQKVQLSCEQLIWDFFNQGCQVVIYDANNGTAAQRQVLCEKVDAADIHVVVLGTLVKALLKHAKLKAGYRIHL
jgi:6-phosphofructo-2-kinase / fructose-2,6-biphosphatase 4